MLSIHCLRKWAGPTRAGRVHGRGGAAGQQGPYRVVHVDHLVRLAAVPEHAYPHGDGVKQRKVRHAPGPYTSVRRRARPRSPTRPAGQRGHVPGAVGRAHTACRAGHRGLVHSPPRCPYTAVGNWPAPGAEPGPCPGVEQARGRNPPGAPCCRAAGVQSWPDPPANHPPGYRQVGADLDPFEGRSNPDGAERSRARFHRRVQHVAGAGCRVEPRHDSGPFVEQAPQSRRPMNPVRPVTPRRSWDVSREALTMSLSQGVLGDTAGESPPGRGTRALEVCRDKACRGTGSPSPRRRAEAQAVSASMGASPGHPPARVLEVPRAPDQRHPLQQRNDRGGQGIETRLGQPHSCSPCGEAGGQMNGSPTARRHRDSFTCQVIAPGCTLSRKPCRIASAEVGLVAHQPGEAVPERLQEVGSPDSVVIPGACHEAPDRPAQPRARGAEGTSPVRRLSGWRCACRRNRRVDRFPFRCQLLEVSGSGKGVVLAGPGEWRPG